MTTCAHTWVKSDEYSRGTVLRFRCLRCRRWGWKTDTHLRSTAPTEYRREGIEPDEAWQSPKKKRLPEVTAQPTPEASLNGRASTLQPSEDGVFKEPSYDSERTFQRRLKGL